ncbi:NUC091 domain-containing protein [Fimicolochytrium jonesii]|uniref:NUC091 domain-containing protein n=1 Tax=Fimicolochytrium jonesii TaxID=1396493 RepID=UPI0022FDC10B|nr:NUC091 domain-containing protein [Fimicolochytrium jonesii]KAI8821630.1 NUC091 domain-containing protein [Fimicolochytrium jonesii]
MGKQKKEKTRQAAEKTTGSGHSLSNVTHVKGVNFYRDAKKVRQVNMLKGGKATRNADGKIIKAAEYQTRLAPGTQARIAPDRNWFTNTRTIGQNALNSFREAMATKADDPYTVIMRQNKLPMSLLTDPTKVASMKLLEVDPFANTFGPKAQRKRPKLKAGSLDDLATNVETSLDGYDTTKDGRLLANVRTDGQIDGAQDPFLRAGQSKRIWNELYKVLDSSDVVIHVLDARDPIGTRCKNVEKFMREEAKHKHLIFVLNKCDLVPTWVTAKWVKILSQEYPTLAFHASINNSFGKGSLIQLLRQFSKLHSDKKQISVGFFGYPNTGKSSIINTLRQKKVCTVAPIPGETKVWQYITLMKRIYLIDCPGVVAPSMEDSETDLVLRGVTRIENIAGPEHHIPAVLERVRPEYMRRTYGVREWEDSVDFLSQVARSSGKLLKGGEADLNTVAKMILNDWLRGKIPYYTMPPDSPEFEAAAAANAAAESAVPMVQQLFSKIPVTAKFLPDDMKRKQPETAEDEAAEEASANGDETVVADDEDVDKEATAEVTDWDEVFESVVGEEAPFVEKEAEVEDAAQADDDDQEDISDAESSAEEEEEETKVVEEKPSTKGKSTKTPVKAKADNKAPSKAAASKNKRARDADADEDPADADKGRTRKSPRMTTNKKKVGEHYYETANVKNKNRKKSKPVDPNTLAKKLQGKGTKRN